MLYKTALITGGSRGLGKALALNLAKAGTHVALVARNADALTAAVQELRDASGNNNVHGLAYDVANKHDIHKIVGQAHALLGSIDLLVHNASTLGPVPLVPLLDLSCEEFAHVLETNVLGPFRLSKALAANMERRRCGTIVHISSDAAISAYPTWGAYGVSKAALDHLTRSWASELVHTRVLAFDPGEMDTSMHRDAIPDAERALLAAPSDVANILMNALADLEIKSGSRVVLSDWAAQAANARGTHV